MQVDPTPTDDEAAAIAAVVTLLEQERVAGASDVAPGDDTLHVWVDASRRSAQRAGLSRGPWRLSGRLPRRSRA